MLALLFAAALVGETLTGPVVALDGGTLQMNGPDGAPEHVRLFGLDAPEMDDRLGPAARATLDDMIAGQPVSCTVTERESRGRLVALCSAGDDDLSEAVLRTGLATADRISTRAWHAEPDLAARFDAAETAARAAGLGVWATTAAPRGDGWGDIRFWQIFVPALTALIGFFAATRYNHHLTMKRDEARRTFEAEQVEAEKAAAQRVLAAELHAEIQFAMGEIRDSIARIEQHVSDQADVQEQMRAYKFQIRGWEPPTMPILETHFGRLGLLPQEVANDLIAVGGLAASFRHVCTVLCADVEGESIPTNPEALQGFVLRHQEIVRRVLKLNEPLAEVAGVAPYDWDEIEAALPPEEDEDAEEDSDDAEA